MAHGTIHKRGGYEPDIELHLYVYKIKGMPPYTQVIVRDLRDWWAAPVDLPETEIDYVNELTAGQRNIFYVPLKLAERLGLCGCAGKLHKNKQKIHKEG